MKKIFIFLLVIFGSVVAYAQKYVDLGLKSGTLWKSGKEYGYYTFDEAVQKYGAHLPRKSQMEELVKSCEWIWTGDGYYVEGPNGNRIFLSADGYTSCDDGKMYDGGLSGFYWSSTPRDEDDAWMLDLYDPSVQFSSIWRDEHFMVTEGRRCKGRSVCLVK